MLDIALSRYDNQTRDMYILATKNIQVKILLNGEWDFIDDQTKLRANVTRGINCYIKLNRIDNEAIRDLFSFRRNPNAKRYPAPLDPETIRITEEAIL